MYIQVDCDILLKVFRRDFLTNAVPTEGVLKITALEKVGSGEKLCRLLFIAPCHSRPALPVYTAPRSLQNLAVYGNNIARA